MATSAIHIQGVTFEDCYEILCERLRFEAGSTKFSTTVFGRLECVRIEGSLTSPIMDIPDPKWGVLVHRIGWDEEGERVLEVVVLHNNVEYTYEFEEGTKFNFKITPSEE